MSDGASLTKKQDGISPILERLLSNAGDMRGAFARIYPLYQKLQTERFESQNASEGATWPDLTQKYASYKPRRYGGGPRTRPPGVWKSWPGGGRKMLFGTSTLAGAAIGPGSELMGTEHHRALFTSNQMTIAVDQGGVNAEGKRFDYPAFVSERRPFMAFSRPSIEQMVAEVSKFVIGGV